MAKLSDEQVENAARAMQENGLPLGVGTWRGITEPRKYYWRGLARAAAPYLQLPIYLPSEREAYEGAKRSGVDAEKVENILTWFVEFRNAANFPKPDPRREKIESLLNYFLYNELESDEMAVKICAALDEVNP